MEDLRQRLAASFSDRYRIGDEIGRGGMATVFAAEDRKHGRTVAVKVLHPELAAAVGGERFLREIEIAARLQHPHIVPLYDSGEVDGLLYYLMPFIEGESLGRRLEREGRLPVDEALRLVAEVAGALDYAHRAGVIHRDVKPDNVMLSGGHALVTDFGIAAALRTAGGESLTQTGMSIGTPAYMSPEQIDASAELDGRTDIYSLGCVLYELVAGAPPYVAPTPIAVLAKKARGEYRPLADALEGVPPGVEDVVAKALERDPSERYATAGELARALAEAPSAVPEPGKREPERSIAVLPFRNMSADAEHEYFGDGMAEEITTALTALPGLRVAARSSAFAFKGRETDPRDVAAQLAVSTVLEGSVRHAGNRARVTVQLINAEDGFQLWSQRFDRTLDDVFAIQDEIAEAVVSELRLTLAGGDRATVVERGTENVEAHRLYWRGRHAWNSRRLPDAMKLFEQAIEHDPGYAAPYAGIADSFSYLSLYGLYPTFDGAVKARAAAERAVSLAPGLADAHFSLGLIKLLFWELFESGASFRRAMELNPNHGLAHAYLATYHASVRRPEQAIMRADSATTVEPLSSLVHSIAGTALYWIGEYDRAMALFERAREIDPTSVQAMYGIGLVLSALGRHDEAIEMLEAAAEHLPVPMVLCYLGGAYAAAGREAAARALLERVIARSKTDPVPPSYVAYVLLALGEVEEALPWVERGFDQRSCFVWGASMWPATRPLVKHPRFNAMLEKAGLGALVVR